MPLVLATYVVLGALVGYVFARARGVRPEFAFRDVLLGDIGALAALLIAAVATTAGAELRWWSGLLAVVGAGAAIAVHAIVASVRHAPDESTRESAYRGGLPSRSET